MTTIVRFAVVAALVVSCLAATACNTVKGVGRDVQSAGRGVERAGYAR